METLMDPAIYSMNRKAKSPKKLYLGMAGLKVMEAALLVLFPLESPFVPSIPGSLSPERQVESPLTASP